jgi:hypothetical protein
MELPDLNEAGNMIEFPVPEQIRVSLKDRKFVPEGKKTNFDHRFSLKKLYPVNRKK